MAHKPSASQPSANKTRAAKPVKESQNYATVGEKLQPLKTQSDILSFCRSIELSRTTASHDLNERSSRSHCLVTVHITSSSANNIRHNTCMMVDLAGSERIEKSKVEGARKAQAIEINKSLTALGRVVKSLGSGENHVPYRDSTLTMLLRDSFGGRASTTVVVCVAGVEAYDEETVRSLEFGKRLGGVRSHATQIVAVENNSEDKSKLEMILRMKKEQLKTLDAGGVDKAASTPVQAKTFEGKLQLLSFLKRQLKTAEEAAYETGAKGSNQEIEELRSKIRNLSDHIEISKYAVDRLSGKRFWRDPSAAFLKKEAEVREIEAMLVVRNV